MSDNEKKFKIPVSSGKCPLCGLPLYRSSVNAHKVADHKAGLVGQVAGCGLRWDFSTGEYWIPESDIPRAVARKLRGVNG